MPTLIPPGYAEIAIEMRSQGDPQPWYNVCGYDISAYGGAIDDAAQFAQIAFSVWLNELPNIVTITGANVSVGQDGAPPLRQYVGNVAGANGAKSQSMLPQNCALLVKKNTASGGRRNRGRAFIPSVLQDDWVDNVGVIANAARNELQGIANNWLSSLNSALPDFPVLPMVILHGTEGAPINGSEDPTVVTSLTVDPVISTQRRRLR